MNLILTSTSGGLDAAAIEPFFYSLRLSGCTAPVAVFASSVSEDCRRLMREHDASVIDYDYRGIRTLRSFSARAKAGAGAVWRYYRHHRGEPRDERYLFFNNARFYEYRDYLLGLKEKPRFVFLVDIRDVVFQSDPFAYPFEPGLSVALENRVKRIRHSWCGVKGMVEAAGVAEMLRLQNQNIVCAGTILADYDTMMRYLDLMTGRIRQRFFFGLLEGIDQGLHTQFVHRGLLSPIHVFENWNGPILTLDSETVTPERKTREGYLCNRDGSTVPIVHQWDRIPGLYREGDKIPACWKLCVTPGRRSSA
ncbi:MAG: hypothetical protein U1F98_13365 [Verrucomicrobiota bacterium]